MPYIIVTSGLIISVLGIGLVNVLISLGII